MRDNLKQTIYDFNCQQQTDMVTREAVIVRRAQPIDALTIATLHAGSFQRGWSEDEVQKLLQANGNISFLILISARAVGFLLARTVCDEAEIISLAVDRAFRRNGFAIRLLEALVAYLTTSQANNIFLEVDEANTAAVKLYRRSGFIEVGLRRSYYISPYSQSTNALVLMKKI